MFPETLRILLKNAPVPALPRCGKRERISPVWQITKVEKMQMSLKGPTFFRKESSSLPLPDSGNYREIDKNFSGFLTLQSSVESPLAGKALLVFENIEHAAFLKVNGIDTPWRYAAPWIFEVQLKKGINKLELRIASSAGNEFFRCFKEELEPAQWKNSYANRFCQFERDDENCGISGKMEIVFLER